MFLLRKVGTSAGPPGALDRARRQEGNFVTHQRAPYSASFLSMV